MKGIIICLSFAIVGCSVQSERNEYVKPSGFYLSDTEAVVKSALAFVTRDAVTPNRCLHKQFQSGSSELSFDPAEKLKLIPKNWIGRSIQFCGGQGHNFRSRITLGKPRFFWATDVWPKYPGGVGMSGASLGIESECGGLCGQGGYLNCVRMKVNGTWVCDEYHVTNLS